MKSFVHTFSVELNWKLVGMLSKIDRFDAYWTSMERLFGKQLRQLKSIATVRSVGASTRIEGSELSDEEVENLLKHIDVTSLDERDQQEVAGYFDVLDLITEAHPSIEISEGSIKNLHNILMKHNSKDTWHKGDYKKHSNAVEAIYPGGQKQIIFRTTEPGFPTQDAMRSLVEWYVSDKETPGLLKAAVFSYDFVSIHPFQDGNGRLSRLLSNLLLLKNGYSWIQYVSLEHEIEHRKSEYYSVLRSCQAQRPNESIDEWLFFFLECLLSMQEYLTEKLQGTTMGEELSQKEKSVLIFIQSHAHCSSGEISKRLAIPNPTVKKILTDLVEKGIIDRHGLGRGTSYTAL